jgi:S1-C subfamily serine protease
MRRSPSVVTLVGLSSLILFAPIALANDVIEAAGRYTVKITTAVDYSFGSERKGTWRGSGFLVDRERGWILTNAHVAGKSPSTVRVSFKDRPYSKVEKVYVDNQLDLAVLRVDPANIPAEAMVAAMKCEGEATAGSPVIAFGHPWGLDYTATRGIISGTKALQGEETLQTDAALNPGNSGGALIDAVSGVVLGVNASTYSKAVTEGLNFAVPAKQACTILNLLRQGKDPSPPILPVTFATTSKERELVVAQSNGDWAGVLKPGDRILAANGDQTARFSTRFVSYFRGGEPVQVQIRRGTETQVIELAAVTRRDQVRRLGVHVSGMVIGRSTVTAADPNVMWVQFLDDASIAEQAQFREGFQVLSIDGVTVKSHEDILAALKGREGTDVEVIVRLPRFNLLDGRFDYFVRTLEVRDIFVVDEKGVRK